MSKTKWYTITVKYTYSDGTPSESVTETYGKKSVEAMKAHVLDWMKSHNRTVTAVEVVEAS